MIKAIVYRSDPIAPASMAYQATLDEYEGYGPVGWGATPSEALNGLIEQVRD